MGGEGVKHCLSGLSGRRENRSHGKEGRTINIDEFKYSLNLHISFKIEKAHMRPGLLYQLTTVPSSFLKTGEEWWTPLQGKVRPGSPEAPQHKRIPMHTHAFMHMHTQANNEHAYVHSMAGKCSELHLASIKKPRNYRLDCKNKSVQTALVLKIYAHQPLGSHLSLPLNTKQERSIYACPIAILLTLGLGEAENIIRMTSWQQQYCSDVLWEEEKERKKGHFQKRSRRDADIITPQGEGWKHPTYFILKP